MNKRYKVFNNLVKLFASFAIFSLVACSEAVVGGTVSNGVANDGCKLSISADRTDASGNVTSAFNGNKVSSNARSILPDVYKKDDIKKFVLYGNSSLGNVVNKEITLTNDIRTNEKFEVVLAYDYWDLTLTAYNNSDKKVLEGTQPADLTNGAPAQGITFHLNAGTIDTVGGVELKGTYTDSESLVAKVTASLTNYLNGTVVKAFTDITTIDGNFIFADSSIAPGTYYFMVKMLNAAGKTIGNWGDLLVVDPDNTTKKSDIDVKIETKPIAPENLKVSVKEADRSKDSYIATVEWEDKSTNEEYFELTITEYDDANNVVGTPVVLGKDFYGSSLRSGGSLLAGNTSCELELPTGHLYDFKIKACNTIGDSSDCARVDNSSSAATGFIGYDIASNKHVNVVSIYYDLLGGSLSLSAQKTVTGNYLDFATYTGSDINLLAISADGSGYARGQNANNNALKKWVDSSESGATEVTKTNKYNNVMVFAYYDETVIINYKIDGYTEMASTRVTANYAAAKAGPFNTDCKNKTIALGPTGVSYICLTVTDAAANEVEYDSFIVKIDGANVSYENNAVISTASLKSGTHVVSVLAKAKGTSQWYSNTFAITITR